MPAISKIRLCNVSYENGAKRYNDQIFQFDGQNAVILLENGGGKTVLIQTILQSIIPHIAVADRKIKDSLVLDKEPAHIAVEWILQEQPRRYALTCVSLFMENGQLDSLKYTYEYALDDLQDIEHLPFKITEDKGRHRAATRGEMAAYYQRMAKNHPQAQVFTTIQEYGHYLENNYKIIPSEWRKIALINSGEGNVDEFFNQCKTTEQLLDRLLIPVVEEAIRGDKDQNFAEIFEKQRDHFKKNRTLQEKIEQSQGLKEEMDNYVKLYSGYDADREINHKIRQKASAYYDLVKSSLENSQKTLKDLDEKRESFQKRLRQHASKEASLSLAHLDQQIRQAVEDIEKKETTLKKHKNLKEKLASRRQNIQLSRMRQRVERLQEEKRSLEEAIAAPESVSEERLLEALSSNSRQIKGYYEHVLSNLEQRQIQEEDSISEHRKKLESLNTSYNLQKQDLDAKQQIIFKKEAEIQFYEEQIKIIRDQLSKAFAIKLDQPLFIREITKKCDQEYMDLQGDMEKLQEERKAYLLLDNELSHELEALEAKIEEESFLARDRERIDQELEKHWEHLKEALPPLDVNLTTLKTAYRREASVGDQLEAKYRLLKEKGEKKQMEMLALQIESLSESTTPMSIHRVYEMLEPQFPSLSLGTDFYLNASEKEIYPYLPMTLLIPEKDYDEVAKYLESYSEILDVPVLLMSMEGLKAWIGQGETDLEVNTFLENLCLPKRWMASWDERQEAERKENYEKEAASLAHELDLFRKEESKWISALKDWQWFFDTYPYDDYEKRIQKNKAWKKELKVLESEKKTLLEKVKEIHKSQELLDVKGQKLQLRQENLETNKKSLESLNEINEKSENLTIQKDEVRQESLIIQESLEISDYERITLQKTIADQSQHLQSVILEKRQLLSDELYKEVKSLEAQDTTKKLETLKQERQRLMNENAGISISKENLRYKLESVKKSLDHEHEEEARFIKQAAYPIEVIKDAYSNEEDDLFDQIKEVDQEIRKVQDAIHNQEKTRWSLEAERKLRQKDMTEAGLTYYPFKESLDHVKADLDKEALLLNSEESELKTWEFESRRGQSILKEALTRLEVENGKYNYLGLTPITLSEEEVRQFHEDTHEVLDDLSISLKEKSERQASWAEVLDEAKASVVEYCHEHVNDFRMKENVINGLLKKSNLQALNDYQERMSDVLEKTIHLAKEDRRESDKELETFLNHLMTYVELVIRELKALQNKTIIELDDGVEPMFIFEIPEYLEEEAKNAMRRHIDRMIDYEDAASDEDLMERRKKIGEAFNIMNLLPVVFDHVPIRIKCRKVNRQMKAHQTPMSWEYSNRWSGGEKWSKNMALFLSLLNYLAEKKQHLTPLQRKNRTVILDNPFGKASSKHVLDPVFFIAERLGFQMIALTAHAEGQFISDYFPVVYSLRLRDRKAANGRLMEAEKILNYTFLQEKAPASVARLQDATQMDLFSYE